MSVDFYACKNCGDTFSYCGDFTGCECGERWCSLECAESDGWREEELGYTPEGFDWVQETSCNFCRVEDVADWQLLNFAMELLNVSRRELLEKYKIK